MCGLVLAAVSSTHTWAQDDFFNRIDVSIPTNGVSDNAYSLFGWVTQKAGFGLEAPDAPFSRQDQELSKFETSVFAQLDGKITDNVNFRFSGKAYRDSVFALNDTIQFTADERNKFRSRFEVKDFFLERQFDNGTYLKVGNQLFAWGLAEYLRVTDIINTEDQLTFGQQDLEDLRLQIPAALVSFNVGDWSVDTVLAYHAGRNNTAPAKDEFDQLLRLRDSGLQLTRLAVDNEYESFVRASTHWRSGDIQLVAGEFNDNELSVARIDGIKSIRPELVYAQNRMRAVGFAGNWVFGSWLAYGELALHKDKAVRPAREVFLNQANGWSQKDQILTAVGVEYNGFRNLVLSLEFDNTHTRQHDQLIALNKDQSGIGARLRWTAINERLELVGVWNALIDAESDIGRLSVNYSWSDALSFGLLWMNYSSNRDSLFYDYRKNDILQLQLQYNFQI